MKKIILFLISLLIGFALFFWVARIVGWQEIKNAFLVFTGWQGLIIFALTLLMILAGVWKWKEILRGQEVEVPFVSLIGPYLAGFAISFLAPIIVLSGEFFRGYLLKKRESLSWSKAIGSVIIDRVSEWTSNLLIILFGILFFLYKIGLPPKNLMIIFGGVFFFFALGIILFYFGIFKEKSLISFFTRNKTLNPKNTFLRTEKELLIFFNQKKRAMWKVFGISFLRAGTMWLRAWLLVVFLSHNIGVLSSLSILGFSYMAAMIPIPASLGSHEIIQAFAFSSLGLGISTATAFTMIIRGAELIVSLIGAFIFLRLGIQTLKNVLMEKSEKLVSND